MLLDAQAANQHILNDETVQLWLKSNSRFFENPSAHRDSEYFALDDIASIATK